MTQFAPGKYVTYLQDFPGIICDDDMLPQEFVDERPHGFYIPVMLMNQELEFEWASLGEVSDFITKPWDQIPDDLKEDYARVYLALEQNLGLAYWKSVLGVQKLDVVTNAPSAELETTKQREARSLTPSPPNILLNPLPSPELSVDETNEETSVASTQSSSGSEEDTSGGDGGSVDDSEDSPRRRPNKRTVTFFIGPRNHTFAVPLDSIRGQKHLEAALDLDANDEYVVKRPRYNTIDPNKFKWVAEFLSTGDFGYRIATPDEADAESKETVFQECMEAYEVAREMVIEDMIPLIHKKLEGVRPWDPREALEFAALLFKEPTVAVLRSGEETSLMKAFVDFLAENIWTFVERYPRAFKERMIEIPGLEKEVFAARARIAEKRAREEEETDSEEGLFGGSDSVLS